MDRRMKEKKRERTTLKTIEKEGYIERQFCKSVN